MSFTAFGTLLCMFFPFSSLARSSDSAESIRKHDGSRLTMVKETIQCTIRRIEVIYEDRDGGYWECGIVDQLLLDALGTKSNGFRILGDEVNYQLDSGDGKGAGISSLTVSPDVMVISDSQTMIIESEHIVSINEGVNEHRRSGLRNVPPTVGGLKALVVRVTARDASPPPASKLANDIFEDTVSLTSQYARCSYNKLNIYPATDSLPGQLQYSATGVIDISVDLNAKGNTNFRMQIASQNVLTSLFGLKSHDELDILFDLVLYAFPPGTGTWVAYAALPGFVSFYNDFWSGSVSALMHEIGHNIGLAHSGLLTGSSTEQEYGDKMGMMGFSYNRDDDPEQCFNPAKNWRLGWYNDKRLDLDVELELRNGPKQFILNGIVDYAKDSTGKYVVIKIGKYYVGFNKKDGFNNETQAAGNAVTVQQELGRPSQGLRSFVSKRLAILNLDDSYSITEENVRVKYISNPNGDDAILELSLLNSLPPVTSPTYLPSKSPTFVPTKTPTSPPTFFPTYQPTLLPTHPSTSVCKDEKGRFRRSVAGRKRNCRWLSKKRRPKRKRVCAQEATKKGESDMRLVKDICKKTCENCQS